MSTEQLSVKAVFDRALDIDDAEARRIYLDRTCAGDLELRRKVDALLVAYGNAGSFLETPAVEVDIAHVFPLGDPAHNLVTEGPGTWIGAYKLLDQIGEGGMGTVYMAEQDKPVRRRVALKIIKPGMDSKQVIARFEAERQAFALMDHQNIARVLDAGATDTGRPYFVMELVHGVRITQYCDDAQLTPRERLALFVPVCEAIQHAHQKGIIHRDVKPSNVLVTLYDGKPVPKVIDFGVAKAINQRLTEQTMLTQYGTVVGTLEYMSPEQAEFSAHGVDTRSDIYSLGVVLYELLTGTTPLDGTKLRAASYTEILRRIKEEEPPKPSTRLSESRDGLPAISLRRHIEPARLTKLVRGELDWIVMKALEKDRGRRYATASALARDLERYLAGDPVEAGPPSTIYKVRKLARKHRAALVTVGAFAGLLLLTAAISVYLAIQAIKAEQKGRVEGAKAKKSAAEALAVLDFFRNHVLAAARPKDQEGGLGSDATIRAAVDAAALDVEKSFAGQPAVEASIHDTLGQTSLYLGDPARTIRHHERALALRRQALGPDHPDTLTSMSSLAVAYWSAGRYADSLSLHQEALKRRQATLGLNHPDTLESMNSLAVAYHDAGRLADALPLYEETIKRLPDTLGPNHPDRLTYMNNLAGAYQDAGRLADAIPLFEETLKRRKATLTPDHPNTLISMSNLARAYHDAGRVADALPLYEQTLPRQKAMLGLDHPNTLTSMNNLALAYRDKGRQADALPLFEETLKRRRATLDANHPDLLLTLNNLALAYRDKGRLREALTLYEEALTGTKGTLGPDHRLTLQVMKNLAAAYQAAGRSPEALVLLEALLKQRQATLGPDHADTLAAMINLARGYLPDRPAQAEPILRHASVILARTSPDTWQDFEVRSLLGVSLLRQKKYAEAEPLLLEAYEGMKARAAKIPGNAQRRLADAGKRVIALYDAWNKPDKSARWKEKLQVAKKQ